MRPIPSDQGPIFMTLVGIRRKSFLNSLTRSLVLVAAFQSASALKCQEYPSIEAKKAEPAAIHEARQLLISQKAEAAAAMLNGFLATHPDDLDALVLEGEAQLALNDAGAASRAFTRALSKEPTNPSLNLSLGQIFLKEHRYPEAMDRFEVVLDSSSVDLSARRGEYLAATELAASAERSGDPNVALKILEHARQHLPDEPKLLMALGDVALEAKQLREAEDAFTSASELDTNNAEALYAIARAEVEEQHMPAAEAHLRAYLAARPNDASAHYGLGHILAMEQRDDEARREFVRSTELQPLQAESYYQLGQLDLNAGQSDEAAKLFQRVILRDPNHGGALVGLGQIAFQARNYPQAATFLERAVKAAPEYGPAHYYYGLTLARLGRKTQADEELKKATELGQAAAKPVQAAPTGP